MSTDELLNSEYPTERIRWWNPYRRCKCCKISVPEINGRLENHATWCDWRIIQEGIKKWTQALKDEIDAEIIAKIMAGYYNK